MENVAIKIVQKEDWGGNDVQHKNRELQELMIRSLYPSHKPLESTLSLASLEDILSHAG